MNTCKCKDEGNQQWSGAADMLYCNGCNSEVVSKHVVKNLPPSYKKMVDWLYAKENPTFEEGCLRLHMMLSWNIDQLLKLKI